MYAMSRSWNLNFLNIFSQVGVLLSTVHCSRRHDAYTIHTHGWGVCALIYVGRVLREHYLTPFPLCEDSSHLARALWWLIVSTWPLHLWTFVKHFVIYYSSAVNFVLLLLERFVTAAWKCLPFWAGIFILCKCNFHKGSSDNSTNLTSRLLFYTCLIVHRIKSIPVTIRMI